MEDFEKFLAGPEMVRQAREEGIHIMERTGSLECQIRDDGQLHCLKTRRIMSVFEKFAQKNGAVSVFPTM